MSQEKLAGKIGVSRQAVAKWEVGQSFPDIEKLIALSDLFRISIDKLVKNYDNLDCLKDTVNQQHYIDEEIIEFLCKARKAAYAGKGAEAPSSRPNSHDLQYVENNLMYIGTYLGGGSMLINPPYILHQ